MISFIKNLFTESAAAVVDKTMSGLDNLFTSDDERMAAKAIIEKQVHDYHLQLIDRINQEQVEVTKRHQADMASGSWLSKNIRPMSLIAIMSLYMIFSISSGNIGEFVVKPEFIELLGTWGMVIMSFYFGGRSFEKITSIVKKGSADA